MTDKALQHRRALLARGRCSECAESVPPRQLLSGEACPHCGQIPAWPRVDALEGQVDLLMARWRRMRWWIYGAVGLGSLVLGFLPLASSVLVLIGLIAARVILFREAVGWLSPRRRLVTRLSLRLWLVAVAISTLVVHEALTLLPGINLVAKPVAAWIMMAAFVELGLRGLRGRLLRDQESTELDTWEWMIPVGLLSSVVGVCVLAVVVMWWVLSWMGEAAASLEGML